MTTDTQARNRITETFSETQDASAVYIGKWNRLISRTNWEKGRIICEWREALLAEGAAQESSDEAWALGVGGISAGHVGRLRRVWQRFGATYEQYEGLYWTHFLVSLDWDDAEMWLEGAAQSGWSVSQMRGKRWETLGGPEDEQRTGDEGAASEWDEDSPLLPVDGALRAIAPADEDALDHSGGEASASKKREPRPEASAVDDVVDESPSESTRQGAAAARVRPFAELPELPDDLAEAFEQFKIAILAHRLDDWQETSPDAVLAALDALKAFVVAPRENDGD